MRIRERALDISSKTLAAEDHIRTPGLHLSDVLDHITNSIWGEYPDRELEGFRHMGFLWERLLSVAWLESAIDSGVLIRSVEVEEDGILMTPDGFHAEDGVLEEWKCTYCSLGPLLDDKGKIMPGVIRDHNRTYWRWFAQVMSYARALGTNDVRLRALWVMGDYRGSGPQSRTLEISFTDEELEENWSMILQNKEGATRTC